jgi:hypothetical protein
MLAAGTLAFAGWMAFGFYALCMVGQLVWVLMAMPETRGGRWRRSSQNSGLNKRMNRRCSPAGTLKENTSDLNAV